MATLAGLCVLIALPAQAGESAPAWDERSRALADQLLTELQAELKQAMQQGGPVTAIEVCRTQAPAAPSPPPEAFIEFHSARGMERRYLRAIPMQPLCLTCHGAKLAPEIAAAVARDYPQDAATGFEPGQLRGAVTVRWPADR